MKPCPKVVSVGPVRYTTSCPGLLVSTWSSRIRGIVQFSKTSSSMSWLGLYQAGFTSPLWALKRSKHSYWPVGQLPASAAGQEAEALVAQPGPISVRYVFAAGVQVERGR